MILADTRGRLTAQDLELVIRLLCCDEGGRARTELERRLLAEGPDALLDAPELPERLLAFRSVQLPSAPLFFYVMVRHTLLRAGFTASEMADYFAALLLEFGRKDRAWRIDWNDDQRHSYLVDILHDLSATEGERRFRVLAHLGNYALWLAGLFPDYIAARRLRKGGPDVAYYDQLGRSGYEQASDHALADQYGLDGIYRTAAARFPSLRQALNQLSDRMLFPAIQTTDRVIRETGYRN